MKLRYEEENFNCETLLNAIGCEDIPSTDISISRGVDGETGLKFMEIDFGKHKLGATDKVKVAEIAAKLGYAKEMLEKEK